MKGKRARAQPSLPQRKLTLTLGAAETDTHSTVGIDPWTDPGPEQITEPLPLSSSLTDFPLRLSPLFPSGEVIT